MINNGQQTSQEMARSCGMNACSKKTVTDTHFRILVSSKTQDAHFGDLKLEFVFPLFGEG